ncbi:hypothetical protein D1B33_03820 [Lysinibacillus yapensis]|uniref:YwpF-like protein n=1 Tax=Ureibacillus yapensis TaxID=2304605 RepID=A0A396SF75_9BACL|nr:YwpF family protein [Lysinibacillus yapensis]RHW39984.1 hypothetical protein D1B33_03820 [Lysinibacillus yapensis]
MKTFKLLSFDLIKEDGYLNLPIVDGIVINQENSHKSWILELFLPKEHQSTFEKLKTDNNVFEVQVIISFPENEPAPFIVKVNNIEVIGEKISVLLKGTIKTHRSKYSEALLTYLLNENLSNDELLSRFKKGMRERPHLKES